MVAIKIQAIVVPKVISIPAFCIRYRDVMRMKAAQPFILMVVQIGSTKRETLGLTLQLSSAEAMVTGKVPADDFEKKATTKAGNMPLATRSGFKPRLTKKPGSTISI